MHIAICSVTIEKNKQTKEKESMQAHSVVAVVFGPTSFLKHEGDILISVEEIGSFLRDGTDSDPGCVAVLLLPPCSENSVSMSEISFTKASTRGDHGELVFLSSADGHTEDFLLENISILLDPVKCSTL